jgi:hypothetical protein
MEITTGNYLCKMIREAESAEIGLCEVIAVEYRARSGQFIARVYEAEGSRNELMILSDATDFVFECQETFQSRVKLEFFKSVLCKLLQNANLNEDGVACIEVDHKVEVKVYQEQILAPVEASGALQVMTGAEFDLVEGNTRTLSEEQIAKKVHPDLRHQEVKNAIVRVLAETPLMNRTDPGLNQSDWDRTSSPSDPGLEETFDEETLAVLTKTPAPLISQTDPGLNQSDWDQTFEDEVNFGAAQHSVTNLATGLKSDTEDTHTLSEEQLAKQVHPDLRHQEVDK